MISKSCYFLVVFTLIFCTFFTACQTDDNDKESNPPTPTPTPSPNDKPDLAEHLNLLFQSNFEGNLSFITWGANNKITGYSPNLEQSNWGKLESEGGIKSVFFNYTGGDETQRYAKIVSDPENGENKTLVFCLNDSWIDSAEGIKKARVQLGLHKITPEAKELFQSVRVYLSEDFNSLKSYPAPITWCTIGEFWNNTWWENDPYGFRISVGIGKPKAETNELYFTLNGQNYQSVNIWNADNFKVKVPIGKWFTMNYYFKDGDKDNGRFYMSIQPDGEEPITICDVHNYTHHTMNPNSKGLQGYEPFKLYTSKEIMSYVKSQNKSLKIYWDDIKIWRD